MTMFRMKLIFGARLTARKLTWQRTVGPIRRAVVKRLTQLGMADSYSAIAG
jgi:hypothetical protein